VPCPSAVPVSLLEKVGLRALLVNAQHVKKAPGRETDTSDAEWLAMLARAGLLRGSFVPPENAQRVPTKLLPSTGHRHARGGEKPPGSPAGRCRVIFPIRDATFFEPIRQGLERAVPAWKRLAL
jgi:hypothetical protein